MDDIRILMATVDGPKSDVVAYGHSITYIW